MLFKSFKIAIFLFFVFIFILLYFLEQNFSFGLFAKNKNETVKFFINNQSSNASYVGLFYLTDCQNVENAEIVGECIFFEKNKTSLNEIKFFFDAKIVYLEKVDNKKVYYLSSPLLKKMIETKTKCFNLQVIKDGENIFLYYPINFDGF